MYGEVALFFRRTHTVHSFWDTSNTHCALFHTHTRHSAGVDALVACAGGCGRVLACCGGDDHALSTLALDFAADSEPRSRPTRALVEIVRKDEASAVKALRLV